MNDAKVTQIKLYFNNGTGAAKPWHVAGVEKRAIVISLGDFAKAETAVAHAKEMSRILCVGVIAPAWLQEQVSK